MKIDVVLSAGMELTGLKHDFSGRIVVVIDVLRATSTILTALANGCSEVIPVREEEDALALAKWFERNQYLLGGERKGIPIPGFDLGNSPLEYTRERVEGKKVILCTTNGTKALNEAADANEVLIGNFLNISRLASYLKDTERDITLFCSGQDGGLSLEDLLCAGQIIKKILFVTKNGAVPELTDAGRIALITYKHLANKSKGPIIAMAQSGHGQYLASIGFNDDLLYCGQVDALPYLAEYKNGSVVLK